MNRESPKRHNAIPALLFWGLVWQAAASLMDSPLLLPTPLQVLRCLGQLVQTAAFWQITLLSLGRILLGMVLATLLGVVLAVITTRSSLCDLLIAPALRTIQAAPVASFAILVLIWVNRDYVPVVICGMMVLPVIWSNVSTGIRHTDPKLLEMAKVYRLPHAAVFRRIYLPSVLPFFRAACSNALGLGWKAGIAAEVLTVPRSSIGRMISESKLYLLTEELFAWTATVVVLSLLLQKLMEMVLNRRNVHA